MARGLELVAQALEREDDDANERAIGALRDMRDRLSELGRVRRAGSRMARRSALWRRQRGPVVQETENAGHLDLLAGSCLMLARTVALVPPPAPAPLVASVRGLAQALADVAPQLGSREARQAAADRALAVARGVTDAAPSPASAVGLAIAMVRTTAMDLMTFAGTEPEQALAAARAGTGELEVPVPPATPRLPVQAAPDWSRVSAPLASLAAAAASVFRRRRRR
jgi:hypothetical protein